MANRSANPLPLLSPEMLDRYEAIEVIGFGAFAMVVKAMDRRSGDLVAIKHFQTPGGQKKKYFQELKFVLRLNHDHIVRCMDISGGEEASSDLVFEYADGGSLRDLLDGQGALAATRALAILEQVASGLCHAHAEGIVHRDLKPENILVFRRPVGDAYKLTDFGIAKFIGLHSKAVTSIGSPAYMAPEQFYDEYDLKSDIYGLGVVAYELLHGQPPFEGSPAVLFKAHLEQAVGWDEKIPDGLRQLVASMLAKKPADRPTASEMHGRLVELARESGVDPQRLSAAARTRLAAASPAKRAADAGFLNAGALFGGMFGSEEPQDDPLAPPAKAAVAPPPAPAAPPQELPRPGIEEPAAEESSPAPATDAEDEAPAFDAEDTAVVAVGHESTLVPEQHAWPTEEELARPAPDEDTEAPQPLGELEITPAPPPQAAPRLEPIAVAAAPRPAARPREGLVLGEGFADSDRFDRDPQKALEELSAVREQQVGSMRVRRLWSRTVDTKSVRLLNLDDGGDILVVTKANIHELKASGGRGAVVHVGSPSAIGTPSRGALPFVEGGSIRVLQGRKMAEKSWGLEADIDQIALSPDLAWVAVVIGRMVCFHDSDGNQLWTGKFDNDASEAFVSFDDAGRLMIVSFDCDDQGVHFYDAEGVDAGDNWMPGRIVGAARTRGAEGAWVVCEAKDGASLSQVRADGASPPVSIARPLRRLVGGDGWVLGVDDAGGLHVVDPATGESAPADVEGSILDFERGLDASQFLVLERRGELLRYITAFQVEHAGAQDAPAQGAEG